MFFCYLFRNTEGVQSIQVVGLPDNILNLTIMNQQIASVTKTPQKPSNFPNLSEYVFLKMMLNGDYLVKDKLGQKYLICHTANKHKEIQNSYDIGSSHLVQRWQVVEGDTQFFQVFPMDSRLSWAGDLAKLKNKSELFCLGLLYGTIKHIIKPLLYSNVSNPQRFILIDNLWFRDVSCFLFLCSRVRQNRFFKTESTSRNKSIRRQGQSTQLQLNREMLILQKMGNLFWDIFFTEENNELEKLSFKEILKAMIKGETTIADLEKIMENKMAKKKFLHLIEKKQCAKRLELGKGNLSIDVQKETIEYGTFYNKLENLTSNTMTVGKGLLGKKRVRLASPSCDSPAKLESLLDSQGQNYPPSFSKDKRFKRYSLFTDSRQKSCKNKFGSIFKQMESKTLTSKTMYTGNKSENKSKNRYYNTILNSKSEMKAKKRRQLRQFFNEQYQEISLTWSNKIGRLEEKSKEKALQMFKKSIDCSKLEEDGPIDDSILKAEIKARKQNQRKTVNKVLAKAANLLSSGQKQTIHHNRYFVQYTQHPIGTTQQIKVLKQEQKKELKVHNNDLIKDPVNTFSIEEKPQELDLFSPCSAIPKAAVQDTLKTNELYFRKEVITNIPIENTNNMVQQQITQGNRNQPLKNIIRNAQIQHQRSSFKVQLPRSNEDNSERRSKQETQKKGNHFLSEQILNISKKEIISQQIEVPKMSTTISNKQQTQEVGRPFSKLNKVLNIQNKQDKKLNQEKITSLSNIKATSPIQQKSEIKQESSSSNSPKKETSEKQDYYFQSSKEITQQIKESDKYKFVDNESKKKQQSPKKENNEKMRPPPLKISKSIKNVHPLSNQYTDQIEEIELLPNQLPSKIAPKSSIGSANLLDQKRGAILPQPRQNVSRNSLVQQKQERMSRQELNEKEANMVNAGKTEFRQTKNRQKSQQAKGKERVHTGQSNASSNGGKSVRKQIDEYVWMVNKMGEAVAKTSKLSKKLEKIEWYIGVFFLYKRFFYERRKIVKYLIQEQPLLTRYEPFNLQEWKQWLGKGEKSALLNKYQQDNNNIQASLGKMAKKMENMTLPAGILENINISKNILDSSLFALDYITLEYEQLVKTNLISEPELFTHICQMINALYVMAELDGKIKQKKSVAQYANTKRTLKELDKMVLNLNNLYQDD